MTHLPRFGLSDAEKDALLVEQAELIQRLAARIAELEAIVGRPRKTSSNSHTPPSKDGPGGGKRRKRCVATLDRRRWFQAMAGFRQRQGVS